MGFGYVARRTVSGSCETHIAEGERAPASRLVFWCLFVCETLFLPCSPQHQRGRCRQGQIRLGEKRTGFGGDVQSQKSQTECTYAEIRLLSGRKSLPATPFRWTPRSCRSKGKWFGWFAISSPSWGVVRRLMDFSVVRCVPKWSIKFGGPMKTLGPSNVCCLFAASISRHTLFCCFNRYKRKSV